jgi:hypothetical protein
MIANLSIIGAEEPARPNSKESNDALDIVAVRRRPPQLSPKHSVIPGPANNYDISLLLTAGQTRRRAYPGELLK